MTPPIDLRSDTVTRPTPAMLEAMMRAPLGDDVLGDDPTVRALEERFADLLGKQAAVFVPSGTMANQIAIKAHTQPGDEIYAHEGAHIIHYEGGAPAALSGCMVKALPGPSGQFSPGDFVGALRPDNDHFARSRLVCVENTSNRGGGAFWPLEQLRGVAHAARAHCLLSHMDGARLWNAHVASGVSMRDLAEGFSTVSCCFSKGLGAPVGSALAGPTQIINRCRRARKLFGGGMRQSGLLAAAATHAMDHHVERLREDHANAALLGGAIAATPGLRLNAQHDGVGVQTNIVLFDVTRDGFNAADFAAALRERGVWLFDTGPRTLRAVTHLDVSREQVLRAAEIIARTIRHAGTA
jgi:threonine aldolase